MVSSTQDRQASCGAGGCLLPVFMNKNIELRHWDDANNRSIGRTRHASQVPRPRFPGENVFNSMSQLDDHPGDSRLLNASRRLAPWQLQTAGFRGSRQFAQAGETEPSTARKKQEFVDPQAIDRT
jgi:hypothetical protein